MAPPHDQIMNQCNLCHLVAQFATDASRAFWWPNLQSVHIGPPGGQNLVTVNEASYGAKIFYLQMAGGAIWSQNLRPIWVMVNFTTDPSVV